jgi:ribosomal protein L33
MSCVPNVASFSGLSSPYILCTQCCQLLWIICFRLRETGNVRYTRHKAKKNNPEKLATLGTQDIRRRQTIQRNPCVPKVASFSGLFVFALCLVYPMLPVSLDCFSSSYVLCTQCCQFLWIVYLRLMSCVPNYIRHKAKTNNPEKLATLGTQDIRRRQTIQSNWQHWVHKK